MIISLLCNVYSTPKTPLVFLHVTLSFMRYLASKESASEFIEKLNEMFPLYYMHSNSFIRFKFSVKQFAPELREYLEDILHRYYMPSNVSVGPDIFNHTLACYPSPKS